MVQSKIVLLALPQNLKWNLDFQIDFLLNKKKAYTCFKALQDKTLLYTTVYGKLS